MNWQIKLHSRVGLYYSDQELRTPKKKAEENYQNFTSEIKQIRKMGEILLMGDFNAKAVKQQTSMNGTLLNKMINDLDLVMLNSSNKCEGFYTRINAKIPDEKSVLDYIIVTKQLYEDVLTMKIFEMGEHKVEGKIPSDHYTISLKLNVPLKLAKPTKTKYGKQKVLNGLYTDQLWKYK